MSRKVVFAPANYYHIYSRGTEQRDIFLGQPDYFRFIALLYLCNGTIPIDIREQFPKGLAFGDLKGLKKIDKGERLVDIGVYCLMSNHSHLLLKERQEKGISRFMNKLNTAYVMYFNKKYERTGRLFESSFKAILVDKDEYLKYLFAYIHLNPIKLLQPNWKEEGIFDLEKARKFLDSYWQSSYLDYIGKRKGDIILTKETFPEYFEDFKEFEQFIDEWLNPREFPEG